MKKTLQVALALLTSAVLFCAGCAVYAPGPDGYYAYDYYPDVDVYYYPAGGYYYWNDGGRWYHGRDLPAHYAVHAESRQSFQGHTTHPWTENHPNGASHPSGGAGHVSNGGGGGNGHGGWQH
ncbi:MAG TPA: hypothetical protein VGN23_04640 [Verrucomicrobiae bacterium]|jgi:hypothetical protein